MDTLIQRLGVGLGALRAAALRPVDRSSLVAFRWAFGALLLFATVRFAAQGWIGEFFGEPEFFFRFPLMSWVPVPSVPVLWLMFAAMAAASLLIALGVAYRAAVVTFLVLFTWVELLDVTNYLNHYYLVCLLCLLLAMLPLGRKGAGGPVRAWMVWLLRFQVAVVYVYAAVAKMTEDWLLHAQPLNLWLHARSDVPVVGPLFEHWETALVFSWGGFLHDLLIVPLLLWPRSRPYAYAGLLCFHAVTGYLLNIGMFPFIMAVAATVFFAPDWPRRVGAMLGRGAARFVAPPVVVDGGAAAAPCVSSRGARVALGFVCVYVAVQVLVPLRFLLYDGPVNWREEGMRFSWRVVVREKSGSVSYTVRDRSGRKTIVPPGRYLTPRQEREMAGQPDLVLQLAHHIRDDFQARGEQVEVYADAVVSLNGRAPTQLVDPRRDLARVELGLDGADWIGPAPETPPLRLRAPSPARASR